MNRRNILAWLAAVVGFGADRRQAQAGSMMGGMMPSSSSPDTVRAMNSMMSSPRSRGEMNQMMGSADQADMQTYMDMFAHHQEIRRSVQQLTNGVRTVTESDDPRITSLLQAHVSKMYDHVSHGQEVRCMSDSLPTMFRNASRYRRKLTMTSHGVAVEETSSDLEVLAAIRRHAKEVSGFVEEGMSAMMRGMMP